jgi:hypothetical protein
LTEEGYNKRRKEERGKRKEERGWRTHLYACGIEQGE